MTASTIAVRTRSNPRRGRRRTEIVSWRELAAYYAAVWRGMHTIRLVNDLRELRERQRAEAWTEPIRRVSA